MLEGAKLIGAGAATIALAGAAIGIGNVFSSLIHSVARNPSFSKQLFGYAIFRFALALTEAIALFALMMASSYLLHIAYMECYDSMMVMGPSGSSVGSNSVASLTLGEGTSGLGEGTSGLTRGEGTSGGPEKADCWTGQPDEKELRAMDKTLSIIARETQTLTTRAVEKAALFDLGLPGSVEEQKKSVFFILETALEDLDADKRLGRIKLWSRQLDNPGSLFWLQIVDQIPNL